jgi:hypothetical protein
VRIIKSITAREVFKRVPAVKKQLWGGEFWTKGYFISTVGRHGNEEVIRQYVKQQGSEKTYKKLHRQDVQMELFWGLRVLGVDTPQLAAGGFHIVYSRHAATHNQVLVPKLKAGFVITGVELSDVFGVLVHLSYFFNPIRRKVLDVRAGHARPDAEVKRYMPFE